MAATEFTSPRFRMRHWAVDDLEPFHRIYGGRRVIWWRDGDHTRADSIAALEQISSQQDQPVAGLGRFKIARRSDDRVVGSVILIPAKFEEVAIEVGYHIAFDHWGDGIATECARAAIDHAFETVGLERMVAIVALENLASLRVMEKLGVLPGEEQEYGGLPHRRFSRESGRS